jgi:hypothetical protein
VEVKKHETNTAETKTVTIPLSLPLFYVHQSFSLENSTSKCKLWNLLLHTYPYFVKQFISDSAGVPEATFNAELFSG